MGIRIWWWIRTTDLDRRRGREGAIRVGDARSWQIDAQYQVQPSTRPSFAATFSFTPRVDRSAEAAGAMRADRVVDIQSGDPLRYREHQLQHSALSAGAPIASTPSDSPFVFQLEDVRGGR
jgi:hypothetical protein